MHNKAHQAVLYALENNWELAVEANLEILDTDPTNIAALNRLGRAYMELGQKDAAKTVYQKVLELDKYNSVALKNLRLLPHQKSNQVSAALADEDFIEETGLTKCAILVKVANREVLLGLDCKQLLQLAPKAKLVSVTTVSGLYVGCLPDDLSARISHLQKTGYGFSVCLKNASDNSACVFLREIKRPAKAYALPSFSHALKVGVNHSHRRPTKKTSK